MAAHTSVYHNARLVAGARQPTSRRACRRAAATNSSEPSGSTYPSNPQPDKSRLAVSCQSIAHCKTHTKWLRYDSTPQTFIRHWDRSWCYRLGPSTPTFHRMV
eukprot:scaffold329123_cov52-Prasinocladus_malaysianus.AAC.1